MGLWVASNGDELPEITSEVMRPKADVRSQTSAEPDMYYEPNGW